MAMTDAQVAKNICDHVNATRGFLGRSKVKHATYASGATFTVVMRDGTEKELTIADPA